MTVNKKGIYIIIIMAIIILILSSGYSFLSTTTNEKRETLPRLELPSIAGKTTHPENYIVNTTIIPDISAVMVYKLKPISNDKLKKSLNKLQSIFNLSGEIKETDSTLVASDYPILLEANKKSGIVTYWDFNKEGNLDNHDIPNESNAIQIARSFLIQNDLLPSLEMDPPFVDYTKIVGTNRTTGNIFEIIIGATVCFPIKFSGINIGGFEVTGTSVGLGTNGEIIFYSNGIRDWEPYKEFPLLSPTDALNQLKKKGIYCGSLTDVTAYINEVNIWYWQEPIAGEQLYLQPVYVFKGEAEGYNTYNQIMTREFTEFIPAIDY